MGNLSLFRQRNPAALVLSNGSFFSGYSIGVNGRTSGEVIFHTSSTGYQEILTDPSYAGQIITLTCPHVGNVGVNSDDQESHRIWASGLVIRELSFVFSNWRAERSLADYLQSEEIVAIAGVDTRRLVRLIREKGVLSGCIVTGKNVDLDEALECARAFCLKEKRDLTKIASIKEMKTWVGTTVNLTKDYCNTIVQKKDGYRVVVYDYGLKRQILRSLVASGCVVTVVPAQTSVQSVLNFNPDGVVLSNGPGDPEDCGYAISAIQEILDRGIPLLGICLGFQLLVLACGGKTKKMKFGHHGANHPVQNVLTRRIYITSQNHSFSVDEKDLPDVLKATHRSLFDGTLQGIVHENRPAIAFQGHPEANPGPQDMRGIFEDFIELIRKKRFK
ncbi:carbamoyl-phosphate synthase small subunit [Coxiella endosymbiont of Amblyomma sculptum]|uniref:glutamine-hydrolyzing carbamoyl-phosphate synthase small subunit n=1 Tax=Coxiella endosymbiont of Amblyomma sculptum TaxID=2487929 RepID=UPI00132EC90C|nr:glutamine-hydrolyzing carbamoyl-phosphate synthase small subunit [Coxiella endosymbiont of Amblyomma sculptum]QHG92512.1 carbamoyl-phosphate synthase small subunit [Coxiella endosymbiont of Amblyomma sculptum]